MSNKRDLKKTINYICGDLLAECIATSLYAGKLNKSDVDALMQSILLVNGNYVRRISHPEPGMPAKKYFSDLTDSFNKQVSEIIDNIGNLH